MITLKNKELSISVKEHGAELCSIKSADREYLWQAYPEFWKRHSPVLFPIVGSVWNGEYRSNGQTYKLGQHGIARDMDFTLVSSSENEVYFELESSEETLRKYPYPFKLTIGYRLEGKMIDVIWKVENPSDNEMFFQIGAHPAFHWPLLSGAAIESGVESMNEELKKDSNRGYFLLEPNVKEIDCTVITSGGCVDTNIEKKLATEAGYLHLNTDSFNQDALILENSQVNAVTLCDESRNPYLKLTFDAPLVGLWSPPGKNAPFVCIEPWYGRTDRVGYTGEYEDKDWIMKLEGKGTFETKYQIEII